MLKLTLKILWLVVLLLTTDVALTVLLFNPATPKYAYLSETYQKHDRLAGTPSPRIVLVGGSGLAYGIDSPRLEQETKLPVVNMGLHAGLGLRFMLSEVQNDLRPGDSVILVPEYEHFYTLFNGEAILLSIIFYNPDALKYISAPGQVLVLLASWFNVSQDILKGALTLWVEPPNPGAPANGSNAFDAQGDIITHLNRRSPGISDFNVDIRSNVNPDVIPALNAFERAASAKGARVYFLFPAIPQELYQKNRDKIQKLCTVLATQTKLVLLDAPEKYAFPKDYFFNTVYHLNAKGRAVRTDKLIAALQAQWSGAPLTACHT